MEWVLACFTLTLIAAPLVFAPLKFIDGYILPQLAVHAIGLGVAFVGMVQLGVFPLSLLSLLVCLYFVYMVMTTFWSTATHASLRDLPLVFNGLAAFLVASVLFRSSALNMVTVSLGVFFVSTITCIYCIGQRLRIDPVFKERLVSAAVDFKGLPRQRIPKWFRNKNFIDSRPIGTIGNTNFVSGYLGSTVPFLVFLSVEVSPWFLLSILLVVVTVTMAECRAALLGMFCSGLVFLLIASRAGLVIDFVVWLFSFELVRLLSVIGAVYVLLFLVDAICRLHKGGVFRMLNAETPLTSELSVESEDQEDLVAHLRYRFRYWKAAWELLKQKPLQGFGLRTFRKEVYQAQATLHNRDGKFLGLGYQTPQPRECHNDYVENFVEGGLVGGLMFLAILAVVFYNAWVYLSSVVAVDFLLVAGVLSGFLCLLVVAFFFFPFRLPASAVLFWVGLALLDSMTTDVAIVTFESNIFLTLLVAGVLAALLWEGSIKPNAANFYFNKYSFSRDMMLREKFLIKATDFSPRETIFRTHAAVNYSETVPSFAEKHANVMSYFYDGMTPAWMMFYNVAMVKAANGKFEEAIEYLNHSLYYFPRFKPALQFMQMIWAEAKMPERRILMKRMTKEGLLAIKLHRTEAEKHNMAIENIILQEKVKSNIPIEWSFDLKEGVFLTPTEAENLRRERQKEMGGGLSLVPGTNA